MGETGSGKTTLGRTILRLIEPSGGEVILRTGPPQNPFSHSIFQLAKGKLRPLRRFMQMIFQDPLGSLNPRLKIRTTLEEGLRA
ncbi:MAG TPA: ATP-binding cassette domain-containing protein, partial [Gemmataceae bacterium]|nr:ATP-binding cassette domain-containing protein [Gemmataceae bacterium]